MNDGKAPRRFRSGTKPLLSCAAQRKPSYKGPVPSCAEPGFVWSQPRARNRPVLLPAKAGTAKNRFQAKQNTPPKIGRGIFLQFGYLFL